MLSAIQQLHDQEIQGAIGWPVDGKIIVRVGCPLDSKFDSEALVSSFAEAEQWLHKVGKLPPTRAKSRKLSVVDELFAAGAPASALWVFDRVFQATFGRPDDTDPLGSGLSQRAGPSSSKRCARWRIFAGPIWQRSAREVAANQRDATPGVQLIQVLVPVRVVAPAAECTLLSYGPMETDWHFSVR